MADQMLEKLDIIARRLNGVEEKLATHSHRFASIETSLGLQGSKLLAQDDRFDAIIEMIQEQRCKFITAHEEEMTILKRLDEERTFTTVWIRRIEEDVKQSKEEIHALKLKAGLV